MSKFEIDFNQTDAVKAYRAKPVTRRTVVKSKAKPTKTGAIWSDKFGVFYPLAWLDGTVAVKANGKGGTISGAPLGVDGKPLKQNPLREFKGEPGSVKTYNGGAWGNGSPIELWLTTGVVKGFISIEAGMTIFNPTEGKTPNNAPIMLRPGMQYRVPAGMAE